jgi:hypothetical protein
MAARIAAATPTSTTPIECTYRIVQNPGGVCDRQIFKHRIAGQRNLDSADGGTMREIYAEKFRESDTPLPRIVSVSSEAFYGEGYEDSDRRIPDISKARALLGWEPKWALRDLLEATMRYYVHDIQARPRARGPSSDRGRPGFRADARLQRGRDHRKCFRANPCGGSPANPPLRGGRRGSKDDTAAALARIAAQFPELVVLTHAVNKGYGAAEKTLLSYARDHGADVGICCTRMVSIRRANPELLRPFDEDTRTGAGLALPGRRRAQGRMPLYKFVANKALTAIENWAFGLNLAEYHSGYMLYSRKTIAAIPFNQLSDSFDFDLEMIVMAHIKGLRIAERAIPTIYAGEVSHLRPIPLRHARAAHRARLSSAVNITGSQVEQKVNEASALAWRGL